MSKEKREIDVQANVEFGRRGLEAANKLWRAVEYFDDIALVQFSVDRNIGEKVQAFAEIKKCGGYGECAISTCDHSNAADIEDHYRVNAAQRPQEKVIGKRLCCVSGCPNNRRLTLDLGFTIE